MRQYVIGWCRDGKGVIKKRPIVHVANCVTTFAGSFVTGKDGLGNTQNYVIEVTDETD